MYAWLIPLLINLALSQRRTAFICAAIACIGVKEDAFMLLFAVSATLALVGFRSMTRADRAVYLVAPPLVALLNLGLYDAYLVPRLRPDGLFYANYWGSYGATPGRAMIGMLRDPLRVLSRAVTSSFFTRVMIPYLFLPLAGWRWVLGIVPVVLLYGASDNEQIRAFGIYYSIVLVPFLVVGAAAGALAVTHRFVSDHARGRFVAAGAIMLGALLAGITDAGYSLRPWKSEVTAVPGAIAQLSSERFVLVQSGLYPHAGYEWRVQLLTADALANPANSGAAVLLAPSVNAWPMETDEVAALVRLPPIATLPGGLIAVRVPNR